MASFNEIIGGFGENFTLRHGNSNPPTFSGEPPIEDEDQIGEQDFYLYIATPEEYIEKELADGSTINEPPVDNYNLFWCFNERVVLVDNLTNVINNYDSSTKLVERLEALKKKDLDPSESTEDKYIYDIIVKSIDGKTIEDFVPITRKINDKTLEEDIDFNLSEFPDDIGIITGVKSEEGVEFPVTDKKVVLPKYITDILYPELIFEENGDIYQEFDSVSIGDVFATVEQGQKANTAIQGALLNGQVVNTIGNNLLQLNNIATSQQIQEIYDRINNINASYISNGTITNEKLADNIINTVKLQNDSVTSAKILNGTITNADISASAGIDVSKISGIANVAFTGSKSGNTANLRSPAGNYLKMAWGEIVQSSSPSTVTVNFPSGLFSSAPDVFVSITGIPTYDNGYRIRTAYINSEATNALTKDQVKIFCITVNISKSTGNTGMSTSLSRLRWFAIGS